ncbi:transposase [Enhygromyxa salina]|uniref:transposase n=1 Tax=Enhygromyxa salina TaxID=215803 RepID=UPI0015E5B050|nr:transposase [Enhygromyxa salina]
MKDTSGRGKLEDNHVPRKKRRTFTKHQKQEAVEICLRSTKPIAQVARDLDLPENSLRVWVKQAKIDEAGPREDGPLTTEEQEELRRLRRENRELKMERDFLKKAAAFFAKDSS